MRMDGDRAVALRVGISADGEEEDLGRFNRIVVAEAEAKTVGLILIQRIRIQDTNVHEPFFEVVGFHQCYSWGERFLDLEQSQTRRASHEPSESHVPL